MINYPLNTPTSIGIANIELSATNAVAVSRSPFTFSQQVHTYPGQMWSATVTIPPLRKEFVEPWVAFLLALRGQTGTFLLGDPNNVTPRGSALGFRRNLLSFTEQFDNAVWGKNRLTVTPNISVAPDGNTTADKIVETTETGFHSFSEAVSASPETTYSISCYFKAAERSKVRLRLGDNASPSSFIDDIVVDLSVGEIILSPPTGAKVEEAGNGWYRVSFFGTTRPGTSFVTFGVFLANDSRALEYTGDGTSGIFIWGAQIEEGSVVTEYQPIAATYGPFVNGAGQTGGTLIVDGTSPNEEGYLLAGDYIQLGVASSATLHKVLQDVNTNEAGQATLEIWPYLRTAPADNAAVTVSNCKGVFRLATNTQSWSINESSAYGLQFDAMEAVV